MPLKPLSDGQRKVLEVLRAAGARGVTTSELLDSPVGSRYSARIGELRKMPGCQISTECVRAGSYRFTLLSEPAVEGGGGPPKTGAGHVPVSSPSLNLFDGNEENPRPLRHYEDL